MGNAVGRHFHPVRWRARASPPPLLVSIVSFLHVKTGGGAEEGVVGEQEGGKPPGGRRIMLDCKFEMCARFPPSLSLSPSLFS